MAIMERLCSDFDSDAICVSWFREAVAYCSELILNKPRNPVWTSVKEFLLPNQETSVQVVTKSGRVPPNNLGEVECQELILDSTDDFFQWIKGQSQVRNKSKLGLLLLTVCTLLLVMGIYAYRKYTKSQEKQLSPVVDCPKRSVQSSVDPLHKAEREIDRMNMGTVIKPSEIMSADGTLIPLMRICFENFLRAIVSKTAPKQGRLSRLYGLKAHKKYDYKTEMIEHIFSCIGDSDKLRVLILFDETLNCDQVSTGAGKNVSQPVEELTNIVAPITAKKNETSFRRNISRRVPGSLNLATPLRTKKSLMGPGKHSNNLVRISGLTKKPAENNTNRLGKGISIQRRISGPAKKPVPSK